MKVLFFDMDGVLVDSEHAITRSAMQALREFGVEADYSEFHQFTGMGEDSFIGCVARLHEKEYSLDMKARTYEIYQQIIPDMIVVYPGTLPLLEKLRAEGIPAAVASSADRVKVLATLKAAGIREDYFAAVITGDDVINKKPAPDIYLLAAKRCGANPAEAVVVEDAVSGIRAAKAAGMECVAVMTSFDEKTLRDAGADVVCGDISGVWECLKGIM